MTVTEKPYALFSEQIDRNSMLERQDTEIFSLNFWITYLASNSIWVHMAITYSVFVKKMYFFDTCSNGLVELDQVSILVMGLFPHRFAN